MKIYHYNFETQTGAFSKTELECKETEALYTVDKNINTPKHRILKSSIDNADDREYNQLNLYSLDANENNARNIMFGFLHNKISVAEKTLSDLMLQINKLGANDQKQKNEI